MTYEPALRLRKGQPRIIGNLMAIAICAIWVVTFLAWGFMPGPTEPRIGVDVPRPVHLCPDPTVLSDPNC